jgi:hypothetical protein
MKKEQGTEMYTTKAGRDLTAAKELKHPTTISNTTAREGKPFPIKGTDTSQTYL